jgi:hypothetical protein
VTEDGLYVNLRPLLGRVEEEEKKNSPSSLPATAAGSRLAADRVLLMDFTTALSLYLGGDVTEDEMIGLVNN